MHAGILHHAVAGANALADIRAERLFFSVGHLQLANVIRLLGDRQALADAADLSASPSASARLGPATSLPSYAMADDTAANNITHHVGLTSKIATGLVLPFTTTSPRGWISYRPFSSARVDSLMMIRVPKSLLSDSSRAPRFTASPITV